MLHEEPAPTIPRHHIEKRNYKRSQAEKTIDLKSAADRLRVIYNH
jgi:hypothetical protein